MANIRENKRNGKTVSFRFIACMERDAQGKQVRRYTTWTPLEGLTPAKAKKAAARAADAWESEAKAEYQKEKEAKAQGRAYMLPPEKRHDDFVAFIQKVWLPLQVRDGNSKSTTVAFYQHMIMNSELFDVAKKRKLRQSRESGRCRIIPLNEAAEIGAETMGKIRTCIRK